MASSSNMGPSIVQRDIRNQILCYARTADSYAKSSELKNPH